MKLHAEMLAEYKHRHDQIWPALVQLLKKSGVHAYSIFHDPDTNILFGYLKVADDKAFERLPDADIMKKWWDYMADIMEVNPDNSPVVVNLQEVFYLE
jgi:L-rhamnose mutarotase